MHHAGTMRLCVKFSNYFEVRSSINISFYLFRWNHSKNMLIQPCVVSCPRYEHQVRQTTQITDLLA